MEKVGEKERRRQTEMSNNGNIMLVQSQMELTTHKVSDSLVNNLNNSIVKK